MNDTHQQLREAFELIKAGRKEDAIKLLTPVLKTERDNADAWWLMANAVSSPAQARQALENVLRLRPDHPKARQMLDKLKASAPPPPAKPAADVEARSSRASSSRQDDPFGDVETDDSDPFADVVDDDNPFADSAPSRKAKPTARKTKSGSAASSNPLVLILAIVGVFTLIGCGICVAMTMSGVSLMGQAVQQSMEDMAQYTTRMPDGSVYVDLPDSYFSDTDFSSGGGTIDDQVVGDVQQMGELPWTGPVSGYVGSFDNHLYTFYLETGQSARVEAIPSDGQVDLELELYDPNAVRLAHEWGGFDVTNRTISVTASTSGTYSIVVSAFASEGSYEMNLYRQ